MFSANADITAIDTTLAGFTTDMKDGETGLDISAVRDQSPLIDPSCAALDAETLSVGPEGGASPANLILENN